MPGPKYTLEICVDNDVDALKAFQHGAHRVEICADLFCGGITPSAEMISSVCADVTRDVVVLVRPRDGDFVYDSDELARMLEDIHMARKCGATGVAIGALTVDGMLDLEKMSSMASSAHGLELVMHRAFDHIYESIEAVDQLCSLGFDRILSSGRAGTALEGAVSLRFLNDYASDVIQIVAAGNVRSSNAESIIHTSLVKQIHSSARNSENDRTDPPSIVSSIRRPDYTMSPEEVTSLATIVSSLNDSASSFHQQ